MAQTGVTVDAKIHYAYMPPCQSQPGSKRRIVLHWYLGNVSSLKEKCGKYIQMIGLLLCISLRLYSKQYIDIQPDYICGIYTFTNLKLLDTCPESEPYFNVLHLGNLKGALLYFDSSLMLSYLSTNMPLHH